MTVNPISHHPKRVLVTGAAGFIGSNLVRALVGEQIQVRALVEPGDEAPNLNGLDVERFVGDLRDADALSRAVQGCDTVYHLGAIFDYWLPEPADMFHVNVEGTVNLMHAAKAAGVKRVVKCSSVASIGSTPGQGLSDEETQFNVWDTADDYILSKYIAEAEAMRFNAPGFEVVAGLPCMPYGRNDVSPTPTGMFVERYVLGQNPVTFTGGLNGVNVKDVAWGLHLCATRGQPGERYILGGDNVTYAWLAKFVCETAGTKPPTRVINTAKLAWLGKINEFFSAMTGIKPYFASQSMKYIGDKYLYFDISKAKRELGYAPGSLEQALVEAVAWFKDERARVLAGEVMHGVDKAPPPLDDRPELVAQA